ncbi:MAG: heavy metal response regulator transcription factor [Prosthecobacter sp.]|jgi:two-component system copper resistance phosphate regulon response regulator CusR|uniref:heavy metal response regulator transcription factor n=1 Tax=Prosthecobacter sp. TaxID=1965333 RepID=UPI0019F1879A|nr:heavy metal response regulator transcription factor [Prosthecobacter sp.]MBE2283596.1 heavy metal response regulator transcription factor [Prosthecobacter sp.]
MRLLIVEDEPKVARFVERGLREEHYAVDVAANGEEGLDLALVHDYDLVILDVMLPKKDGFEVLEALRAAKRPCKVLMLTARDSVKDRVRGLDGGADDYLVKPFAFAELLARVRALLRRSGCTETTTLSFADLVLDVKARKVTRAGQPVALSAREFAVLEHLLRHQGEVISRTRLSEQVWDQHFDSMTNVIDVTLYHLREKVDRGFASPLIHTVRGVGYVLKNPAA